MSLLAYHLERLTRKKIREYSFWKVYHGIKKQKKRKLTCSGRIVEDVIHDFVETSKSQSSFLNSLTRS